MKKPELMPNAHVHINLIGLDVFYDIHLEFRIRELFSFPLRANTMSHWIQDALGLENEFRR